MVDFTQEFKEYARKRIEDLYSLKDPGLSKGLVKIESRLEMNTVSRAKHGDHPWDENSWVSNGPFERIKKPSAPGPLQYFISALGFCQQNHYGQTAGGMRISIKSLGLVIRAKYDVRPGYGFEDIEYETRIESDEDPERIKMLVTRAEHECYATNTLSKAFKLRGSIYLNGSLLMNTEHDETKATSVLREA